MLPTRKRHSRRSPICCQTRFQTENKYFCRENSISLASFFFFLEYDYAFPGWLQERPRTIGSLFSGGYNNDGGGACFLCVCMTGGINSSLHGEVEVRECRDTRRSVLMNFGRKNKITKSTGRG